MNTNFILHCIPRVTLDILKNNFVFKSSSLWNCLIRDIFERSSPSENGVVVAEVLQLTQTFVPFNKNK